MYLSVLENNCLKFIFKSFTDSQLYPGYAHSRKNAPYMIEDSTLFNLYFDSPALHLHILLHTIPIFSHT